MLHPRRIIIICLIVVLSAFVGIAIARYSPKSPGGLAGWAEQGTQLDTDFHILPWNRIQSTVTNRTNHIVYDVSIEINYTSSVKQKVISLQSLDTGASITKINHLPNGVTALTNTPPTYIRWRNTPSGPIQVETYPKESHD